MALKTLATCTPREFLVQTNKIRKSVEKWLSMTKIMEIRKNMPDLHDVVSPEDRKAAINAQARRNISAILDSVLEEHPDETLELLALMCFIDPAEVDLHPMNEYLKAFAELLADEAVISFFTSLIQLGEMNTLISARA